MSAADETEVPAEAIVKGYELPSGQYVLIDDAELSSLDPEATRTIDIEEFVDLDEIDPIFYDAAYYVAPDKATTKPYALLARAMEETGKVGIARFVMRSKQYLAAIRPEGRQAAAVDDGLRRRGQRPGRDQRVRGGRVGRAQRPRARRWPSSSSSRCRRRSSPSEFHDTYREKVLELIERKAAGETGLVEVPERRGGADKVVDLMAALEASVAAAKEAAQAPSRPTSRPRTKPAPAKKAAPRKRKAS